jgi:hypothetical protein
MTGKNDATRSLRLTYNAALAAHQGCMRALTEASMAGTPPSALLVESEAKARRALDLARERLLAAMTEAITGHKAGDPAALQPLKHVENGPPDSAS